MGDAAVDALYVATYRELRQLAHSRLRGGGRNTVLDTTALVHESYLRLSKSDDLQFRIGRAFPRLCRQGDAFDHRRPWFGNGEASDMAATRSTSR